MRGAPKSTCARSSTRRASGVRWRSPFMPMPTSTTFNRVLSDPSSPAARAMSSHGNRSRISENTRSKESPSSAARGRRMIKHVAPAFSAA